MALLDVRRVKIQPSNPRHSQHGAYLKRQRVLSLRQHRIRMTFTTVFVVVMTMLSAVSVASGEERELSFTYDVRNDIQKIRIQNFTRYQALPLENMDPKTDELAEYLQERGSPLADYAGLIARMPNRNLILGIAQAESNLCKKTDKNNCWGIGPGGPWSYEDIANSLYHVNYLIDLYRSLGMNRPETMVRTYVGYHNPNWVQAVNTVMSELQARGL